MIEMVRKFLLCGCLRFVAPESASQVIFGICFCVCYLSAVAFFAPYKADSDDFFGTICQVITLCTFIVCLTQLMRRKLTNSFYMIEQLDGPEMDVTIDEWWFNNFVAFSVCAPVGIALLLAMIDTYWTYYSHWRHLIHVNPAFPPSAFDFWLRGQETSLPGRSQLNRNMPEDALMLLDAADEDVTSEVMANSINGNLHTLIEEARHFAAVLYAPGESKMDFKDGNGPVVFPPPRMRAAYMSFLEKLVEYTHEFTCGEVHTRMTIDPVLMLEPELEALEHVYPVIQERHRARLRRIKKLSQLETTSNLAGPKLVITVLGCKGLKGGGVTDRLPDPYVEVKFIEMERDGYKTTEVDVLHKCKTKPRKNTCDPKWKGHFTTCRLPLGRTRMRLTVMDKDRLSADDFLGQVTLNLKNMKMPFDGTDVTLQPQKDKAGKKVVKDAQGSLSFHLREKRESVAFRIMGKMNKMISNIREEEDPHELLCKAMKKKARFITDTIARLQRIKHYVERLPQWKKRVHVRQRASVNWTKARRRVHSMIKMAAVMPVGGAPPAKPKAAKDRAHLRNRAMSLKLRSRHDSDEETAEAAEKKTDHSKAKEKPESQVRCGTRPTDRFRP